MKKGKRKEKKKENLQITLNRRKVPRRRGRETLGHEEQRPGGRDQGELVGGLGSWLPSHQG